MTHWLLDPGQLTPRGFFLLSGPGLIWTHALSDLAIAAAYLSIPLTLLLLARRRRDFVFRRLFWLFASFILLCGIAHLLDVVTLWVPAYRAQAAAKAATAVASASAAVSLWWLLPRLLSLPSTAQLRSAAAALEASEARFRTGLERSPVPVYTLDGAGRVMGASESWLALLGYTRAEAIGRPITDFEVGSWPPEQVERLRTGGEVRDVERPFVCKDGTRLDTLVSARLERSGETDRVACVLIDISARRRAELALRDSEERMHQMQKMDAVGQLTGGIAHDFNNMLQGIAGGLDLMERRMEAGRPEEAERYLLVARKSLDRAAGLTHRMLAFARRQALQPREVDPAALVRGVAELIRRTVGPGVQLLLQLDGGDWHARRDGNQLESALLNLAINARDAMGEHGTVTVTLADRHVAAGPPAEYLSIEPGDYVEVAVADTGAGMPPDVLARAFEPFFTTKPIGQGTGLGLSQVYGFARQSGGTAQLQSSPGRGTTVLLFLPRHRDVAPPAATATVDPSGTPRVRGAVLLVEDEAEVRAVVAEALRDLGCDVVEAADGPAGLAAVQSRRRFDLLLTDVGLPGLNGRQLADAARERDPSLPVLLITGYAGTALDQMALAPRMEVLRKPFTLHQLSETVGELLRGVLVG